MPTARAWSRLLLPERWGAASETSTEASGTIDRMRSCTAGLVKSPAMVETPGRGGMGWRSTPRIIPLVSVARTWSQLPGAAPRSMTESPRRMTR